MRTLISEAGYHQRDLQVDAPVDSRSQGRLTLRGKRFKSIGRVTLFLALALVIQFIVVSYSMSLGARDPKSYRWSFQPTSELTITIVVSPLFHFVPIAVTITLLFCWMYLARITRAKPGGRWRGRRVHTGESRREEKRSGSGILAPFSKLKSRILRIGVTSSVTRTVQAAGATAKSAIVILVSFGLLILFFSLLAYPAMLHSSISKAYQANPTLLGLASWANDFGQGIAEALSPIQSVCSSLNSAILSVAPGFRAFVLSVGSTIGPLVALDDVGKYLFFQNLATWMPAMTALLYKAFRQNRVPQRKRRRR